MERYRKIADKFLHKGDIIEIRHYGDGLINDTFKVITGQGTPDYILQKINNSVFKDVEMLQNNIDAVTSHLYKKELEAGTEDIGRHVLEFIRTESGKSYWYAEDLKEYWRMMVFIDDAYTYTSVTPENARLVGKAISEFHSKLADIPVTLGETIPNFHNMAFRLEEFREAVRNDKASRAGSVKEMIDAIEERAEYMTMAERLYKEGRLPKRVCHCDTKINNMLFDKDGNVLAIIDLDTVMPSFIFSDYGDFLRNAANLTAEDDPDMSKVGFNNKIFESFTEGYLEGSRSFITDIEKEMLPYAVKLFPYMQCVRFLGDYINGDTYYKIKYPLHNLDRAKNQFTLLKSIEEYDKDGAMGRFIEKLA